MNLRRFAAVSSLIVASFGCSVAESSSEGSSDAIESKTAPLARFAPYLKTLKTAIETPATAEEAANNLLGTGRPASFSLQALFRIYADEDARFDEAKDDFKSLEDGIGAYGKWDEIYQAGVTQKADAATLEKLKKNRDDALVAFTKVLTDKGWRTDGKSPTRIAQTEDFLQNYAWKERNEDRKIVFEHISDELKGVVKTQYDMKILEEGDGLHELRRDIRWVLIEQLGLNGMITLRDSKEACPIAAYASLVTSPAAANRYAQLPATAAEPYACKISACLVIAAAKAVDDIGAIKDEAEQSVNIAGAADVVPDALQPKAQALYDELLKNNLAGVFKDEIDACQDALQ